MKPSDLRTSSTRARRVEAGDETVPRRRSCALRMRVSISPIGSVRLIVLFSLPARLDHAGDLPKVAELAQRDTAHLELPVVATRTARHFATIADAARRRVARQRGQLELSLEAHLRGGLLVLGDRLKRGAL